MIKPLLDLLELMAPNRNVCGETENNTHSCTRSKEHKGPHICTCTHGWRS